MKPTNNQQSNNTEKYYKFISYFNEINKMKKYFLEYLDKIFEYSEKNNIKHINLFNINKKEEPIVRFVKTYLLFDEKKGSEFNSLYLSNKIDNDIINSNGLFLYDNNFYEYYIRRIDIFNLKNRKNISFFIIEFKKSQNYISSNKIRNIDYENFVDPNLLFHRVHNYKTFKEIEEEYISYFYLNTIFYKEIKKMEII